MSIDLSLSETRAAAYLGINVRTLRRWAEAGRVPFRLAVTRRRVYDPVDVERLKAGGKPK